MNSKVVIVQRRLTHYRVAFFEQLRDKLLKHEVSLQLLVGEGTLAERSKKDSGEITWATPIPTKYFFKSSICWQPVYRYLNGVDLVIVSQENAQLVNHFMIFWPRKYWLAYWGHGANLQSDKPDGIKEKFKRFMTSKVDWWFAYTKLSADLVLATGFPPKQLSIVNNTIDVKSFLNEFISVSNIDTKLKRSTLGIEGPNPVGIFLGSLYSVKRIDFLLAAAVKIRGQLPNFKMIFIGDGPERSKVQSFCNNNSWARWVGAQQGKEKALLLSCADIMLCPSGVGLGILDSFASQTPMITTDSKGHGPEISYLDDWNNGVMTTNNLDAYVEAAVKLLLEPELLAILKNGCSTSAHQYSLEEMIDKFANGILSAIDLKGR